VRSRAALLVAGLLALPAAASESDDVTFIRADGAPGWAAAIARPLRPEGVTGQPLSAPAWFAKLPDATVPLAPTGSFDLATARGKVLLLDYWASWCAPCLKELPHLQELVTKHAGDPFVALAINADEPAATAFESAKRIGMTMTIGVNDPALYRTLAVHSLPALLVIDKDGRLRGRWDGYRPGFEKEIEALVAKLIADDPEGTTRELATVVVGPGRLTGRWFRELAGTAEGVLGLPKGLPGNARVVASTGAELASFDDRGETVARIQADVTGGRLIDLGEAADGAREVLGFHPGATSVGIIALRTGTEHAITVPAPALDVALVSGAGDSRKLAIATLRGAALAGTASAHAALKEGSSAVRGLAAARGGPAYLIDEDGSIRSLAGSDAKWAHAAKPGERLIAARSDGVYAAPRTVLAAVSGRFLPGDGRQLAVATYAGHLVLLDEASGAIVFDAAWPGVHELSAIDLDGDGFDELLVAADRDVAALGAKSR
jgi:thiol-disulfide isomerase/thioredoxin